MWRGVSRLPRGRCQRERHGAGGAGGAGGGASLVAGAGYGRRWRLRRSRCRRRTGDRDHRRRVEGIATGLAGLLALLDPEAIVLGGGLVGELAPRWDELLERTRDFALPRYAGGVPVERTTLGDDASLLGASLIALQAARG